MTNEFGKYTTLGERLQELHDRLIAWYIITEDEYAELWNEVYNRFCKIVDESVDPLQTKKYALLEAFEQALSDWDTIWIQSAEMAKELEDVDFDGEQL